jgi:3',5'-nucleoside bisphosphate phosphatase
VLGFIPEKLNITAVEIAMELEEAQSRLRFLKKTKYSIIRASDAHDIQQLGTKVSYLYMKGPSFEELKYALAGYQSRKVSLSIHSEKTKSD